MEERMFLLDIERQLHGDVDGSFRRTVNARLEAARKRLRAQLSVSTDPASYREYQAALQTVEGAMLVMARFGA